MNNKTFSHVRDVPTTKDTDYGMLDMNEIEFTRYLHLDEDQVLGLLERLFVQESIPERVENFHVYQEELVIQGTTTYNHPTRLEVEKELLGAAAKQENLLETHEDIVGFGKKDKTLTLLIKTKPENETRSFFKKEMFNSFDISTISFKRQQRHLIWTVMFLVLMLTLGITTFTFII